MKPILNLDFSEAKFNDEQIPNYTKEFMDQMRDHMYHVRKFEEMQKNQIPKLIPQRPISAQTKNVKNHQEKHKYLKKKQPTQVTKTQQTSSQNSSKIIKQTYISETIPVINSNSSLDVQITKQPYSLKVCKNQIPKPQQINNKSQKDKDQVYGLYEWEEEIDGQFYIKEAMQLQESNIRLQAIEKANREQFLQKINKQNNIPLNKEDILKKQQIDIEQKQNKLQQLRSNNNNNQQEQEDDYGNDFENEDQIVIKSQEDEDYDKDGFEVDDENKNIETIQDNNQLKQIEILNKKQQNKPNTDSKSSLTQNSKSRKKFMYRPKNAKERKQELESMREELEKNLIQNDSESANLYQLLQDSKEKERVMIEVNTKRRDELVLARLTLQQLADKIDQQLHIIDDLDKKDHYAQQIIEKLKENRTKQQQQYDNEIEKFLACKVIARLLKGKKDRRLFLELRRQKFMNMLKQ